MNQIGVGFFVGAGIPKRNRFADCQTGHHHRCDPALNREIHCECECHGDVFKRVNTFIECGCCGAYHRTDFEGDCREDGERYYDLPEGAIEVYED